MAALALVTPMVVAYELGTWAFHLDTAARTETRIVAFTWVRDSFDALGATGAVVAPLATVALLLGWHIFAREPWRLRLTTPGAMVAESILLAVPLLLIAAVMTLLARHLAEAGMALTAAAGQASVQQQLGMAVLGVGAGVYEELVFRLVGFVLLHTLLRDVLGMTERSTLLVTLVLTSLAFAAYHHVPGTGEPWQWGSFAFRAVAGGWLGLVFVARGFGLAAGSHAAYDLLLVLLPALLVEA